MTTTQSTLDRLDRYIRARYPIIAHLSHEEIRILEAIRPPAAQRKRKLYTWAITCGLAVPFPELAGPELQNTQEPIAVLEVLLNYPSVSGNQGSYR